MEMNLKIAEGITYLLNENFIIIFMNFSKGIHL